MAISVIFADVSTSPQSEGRTCVRMDAAARRVLVMLTVFALQYFRTMGFAEADSDAAGEIAKVTHVLQVLARFSVSRSLYPLRLR